MLTFVLYAKLEIWEPSGPQLRASSLLTLSFTPLWDTQAEVITSVITSSNPNFPGAEGGYPERDGGEEGLFGGCSMVASSGWWFNVLGFNTSTILQTIIMCFYHILIQAAQYCRRLIASRDVKPGELVLVDNSLILVPTIEVLLVMIVEIVVRIIIFFKFFTESLSITW